MFGGIGVEIVIYLNPERAYCNVEEFAKYFNKLNYCKVETKEGKVVLTFKEGDIFRLYEEGWSLDRFIRDAVYVTAGSVASRVYAYHVLDLEDIIHAVVAVFDIKKLLNGDYELLIARNIEYGILVKPTVKFANNDPFIVDKVIESVQDWLGEGGYVCERYIHPDPGNDFLIVKGAVPEEEGSNMPKEDWINVFKDETTGKWVVAYQAYLGEYVGKDEVASEEFDTLEEALEHLKSKGFDINKIKISKK